MSIIDYYLDKNVKDRLISFDSSDMCISDSYDSSHESNFYKNTTDYSIITKKFQGIIIFLFNMMEIIVVCIHCGIFCWIFTKIKVLLL